MKQTSRVSVLLESEEAELFDAYCKERGFKKSSLIVRLVREHLEKEGYAKQGELFANRFRLNKKNIE